MLNELEQLLLHRHVIMLSIGAFVFVYSLRKVWAALDIIIWTRKIKPLYPVIFCQIVIQLPGIVPEANRCEKVLLAFWAGFLSAYIYQLVRRIVGKYGIKMPEKIFKTSYPPAPEQMVAKKEPEKFNDKI